MDFASKNVDVFIVGAGPTGLMMAAQLAIHNISFRIVDKKENPTAYSGALAVQARSIEIFDQMGIAQKAIKQGTITSKINIVLNGRKSLCLTVKDIGYGLTKFPYILLLEQSKTEQILIDFISNYGYLVERELELEGFIQDSSGVTSILKSPDGKEEIIRSKYLIGADGGQSTVRKQLNIPFIGKVQRIPLFVLDCKAKVDLPPDEICFSFSDACIAGFFPLNNGMWRIDGTIPEDLLGNDSITFSDIEKEFAKRIKMDVVLCEPKWFSVFHAHERCASSFKQGRSFLLGDAAHIHSPVGAQGMNTGFQDAYNLAWKLALVINEKAKALLLDTYVNERITSARKLVQTTDKIFRWVTKKKFRGVLQIILRIASPIIEKQKAVRQYFFRMVSQLNIHYRKNILSENASLGNFSFSAPKPGDRLPFLTFIDEGTIRNLQDKVIGKGFKLLLFSRNGKFSEFPAIVEKSKDVISIEPIPCTSATKLIYSRLGILKNGYYLIRPDLHIAYRSNMPDVNHFENYLRQFLLKEK